MTKRHPGDMIDGRLKMEQRKWHPNRRLLAITLLLFWLFFTSVYAEVTASVDSPAVYRGDPVTLTLSASGDDITFPTLTQIAGYAVQSQGTSRNLSIVNGRTTRTIEQRLLFTPTADVTIPSLDITVDGNTEHTLPIAVRVLEPQAAPAGAPVQLQMKLSKTRAYVGEPVTLDLIFKYKPGEQIDDIRIAKPKLEHFWIKRINDQPARSADEEGYITQTYQYLLFAQQSGERQIEPVYAQVGIRAKARRNSMFSDPFFNDPFFGGARMEYKKVYSNPAVLQVNALPDGLEVYGDFTMKADVDKTTVDANKPVNLHIHIEGHGNVEDIRKFEPRIADAVVYANDPQIKSYIKDGQYYGTFDQTVAIIPARDITIEPQELRYFDSRTKAVNTLRTHPFFIKVTGAIPAAKSSAPALISAAPATPAASGEVPASGPFDPIKALLIFAAGFVIGGAFVALIALRSKDRSAAKTSPAPMAKKIKAAKTAQALFELLLPFKDDAMIIDKTLDELEANLYRGAAHKIDRKALIAYFEGKSVEEVDLV